MTTAPYGSWASSISVESLTSGSVGLGSVQIDGDQLYWLESYADQGGRTTLWRRPLDGGPAVEVTPGSAYLRNRVHEYGGGEYAVRSGVIVYTELSDGRIHRIENGRDQPITPRSPFHYGDLRVHPDRGLVLAVREDHSGGGEPVNTIVALDLAGPNAAGGTVLCSGADFYSTPELSQSGRLAWTQWDHPNMPWDSAVIMVGNLAGLAVPDAVTVAGGAEESAVQPRWHADHVIFLSDRSNWWNLYRWQDGTTQALHPMDAEFAFPQWTLGQTPYAVIDDDRLLCSVNRSGEQFVAILTISTGELSAVSETGVAATALAASPRAAAAVLVRPDRPPSIARLDLDQRAWHAVTTPSPLPLDPASVSRPTSVSWPGSFGPVQGWFYPPAHAEFHGPDGTRPPLITLSHGGPTGFAAAEFRLGYQFWTNRGFAILDVNYSGSGGFGREYRDRLQGQWGVLDVDDCVAGAQALVDRGLVDPAQLVIKGGSAGGYTTLQALTRSDVFTAGIVQYGVADLEALARDTHKFELRYLDGLVGPYPEAQKLYRDRSPIHHLDQLSAPILLLQGADDKVVPPSQTETLADAARAKGLPVAMIMFAGEGHGFRSAATIKAATEAQIDFLSRIYGFTPADRVPPIEIDNFP
ncbi:MAG TPA: prolyl oligopeptidase family serine peptidase [Propionibacteriaceae bacterium]|nr:prolyl oligopeptidase family serine peptidase [Propionibacteriaceae bacterium]